MLHPTDRTGWRASNRALHLLLGFLWTMESVLAQEPMIKTSLRDGQLYVAAAALSQHAGIAIKSLPGQKQIVACAADRCAPVPSFLRDGDEILVPVTDLSQAIGATAQFDATRARVRFEFSTPAEPTATAIARVGQLAPNLRFTKLDGGEVALSDFRGQRVLINSWASW